MKNTFKTFSEKIERELKVKEMWVPDGRLAGHFRAADNHEYRRISVSWRHGKKALDYESKLIKRLEVAADLAAEVNIVAEERYENQGCEDDSQLLQGLDVGVASVVLILSALGCVTYSSCNGGCFGDSHKENYPLVKPEDAPILLKAAKDSRVGIGHAGNGLMVWANDIRDMVRFAAEIVERYDEARKKRGSSKRAK